MFSNSLHRNQEGYFTLFEARAGFDLRDDEHIKAEFDAECGKCHTSCGQCHISRPESVEGGFIDGHIFKKTPSMTNNCTACHGSRVGDEYLGKNEDLAMQIDKVVKGTKRDDWRGHLAKENEIKAGVYNQLMSYQKETGIDIANEPPEPYGIENKVERIFNIIKEQKEY